MRRYWAKLRERAARLERVDWAKWRALARRHFFLTGALGLLALMVFAGTLRLAFMGNGEAQTRGGGERVTQVSAVVSEMRPFVDQIEALGTAKGRQSVNLSANNTEQITAIRFRDGDYVRRGQVLVDLKATEEAAEVLQARAALDVARTTYNRYDTLARAGFLAPAAMDQYRANYRQAQANLAAAQSRVGDRVIRAPFSGRVGLTDIAPGALVNPGATIVTLDDTSVMRVDFDVPDRFLPMLRQGAPINARPDPYPTLIVAGRVALVDSRIDPTTHAIRARAEFTNPQGLLVPGMLLHVAIQSGERQSVAVPEAAVQTESDQSYVYVIARQGQRTIARQTAVQIGADQNGYVEIRDGLPAGVRVVADGLDRVQPNGPVRIGPPRRRGGGEARAAG